jgi:protease-4
MCLVLCLLAGPARADEIPASPFRGVVVPGGGVAGDADATALQLNPGQLALLSGGSGALLVDYWGNDVLRPGRGGALMLGGPLVGGLALGAGFQWLRPSLPGWPEDYQKVSLGAAVRLGRGGGFGFSWDHLWSAGFDAANSFSIGLGLRLHPMLALGFVVRDVNRPNLAAGTTDLPREWDMEAVLRPTGLDWLEVAGGVRLLQGGDFAALPRARVVWRLARGLSLFGEIDWPYYRVESVQPDGTRLSLPADYLATVGLTIEQGRAAASFAGFGNWEYGKEDSAGFNPGGSIMLRLLPARREPLVAARYVARVELGDLESDRRFLGRVVELRRLGDDPVVGAILLEIEELQLGLGRIEELRQVIADVRRRKPVFARVVQPSTREYYLASACERVFMDPAGGLYLGGLAQTVTFYKGALDRLGVNVELVRIA